MQQRYYDPMIGRFLSVDPVTALSNPARMFNRYDYAANNPYRFTDPDGRQSMERKDWSSLGAHSSNMGFASTSFVSPIDTGQLVPNRQTTTSTAQSSQTNATSTSSNGYCDLGNAFQDISTKASDFGLKVEGTGFVVAGMGLEAGPEGAAPGVALMGTGGLISTGGSGFQLAGGLLQLSSDRSTGMHNITAGITSLATFGLTKFTASSYMRSGNNYVARTFNRRIDLGFSLGGTAVDFELATFSDFFRAEQANCENRSQ
jgi:uncharacterized protein RhaS with RHS repeats